MIDEHRLAGAGSTDDVDSGTPSRCDLRTMGSRESLDERSEFGRASDQWAARSDA
jgi:hypothetical protein